MIIVENYILEKTKLERQDHLNLSESCIERGGCSTNHKGTLAQYLNTNIPHGIKYPLCHACHNGKCSNPKHLYWGTPKENVEDMFANPSFVKKVGYKVKNYNYIWITDGVVNKRIKNDLVMPEGYKRGLTVKESNNKKGINGFTTGTQIKGHVKHRNKNGELVPINRPGSLGQNWITDGVINRRVKLINGVLPEGFKLGRTLDFSAIPDTL